MCRQPVRQAFAIVWLAALTACSGDDKPEPLGGTGGVNPQTGGAPGGGTGGASAAGGIGGDAGASLGGAGMGGEAPGVCGDGTADPSEACDGDDFSGTSCVDFGFDTGTLDCSDCEIETVGCSGTETCFDGRDNDGDRLTDCSDDECSEACAASCPAATILTDPASVTGDTTGHASLLEPSCALTTGNSEVVYLFTATRTGVLDVRLSSGAPLMLSVRDACDGRERACTLSSSLESSIRAGDTVYVLVDGLDIASFGSYELSVSSRTITCGDRFQDGSEQCDDGNLVDNDGCSGSCTLELSESEPNNDIARANPAEYPFVGAIGQTGDVDVVAVTLTEPALALVAQTTDFGDGACLAGEQDSNIEILDETGAVLASNDDTDAGLCALASTGALAPGTYYVRVSASPIGDTPRFAYVLLIEPDLCGNDVLSPGEGCDDGNQLPADGCSDTCQVE
jgi:cysteine-rich repeat protein